MPTKKETASHDCKKDCELLHKEIAALKKEIVALKSELKKGSIFYVDFNATIKKNENKKI